MMFGFFNNKPLLTEDSVQWLFDTFAWSLENFDSDVFYNETILVVPSNKYFPGRANGIHGMARLIFEQVKEYAGLKHWPCVLVDQSSYVIEQTPKVMIEGALRGSKGIVSNSVEDGHRLPITYDPRQVNNPETLIATYAHALAHYLGSMARQPPPGDKEHWLYATEILAV
ncbi:MAG: hypothetical protein GY862_21605, partial [Gammaproteobacteria bacterium]|nr:hypothetical protein [Gammaproteobacteria bacterium]